MKVCDVCQRELEEAEYVEYSQEEWRTAIRNGFSIFRVDICLQDGSKPSFADVARALGVTPAEAESRWRDMVLSRSMGNMALCPECDAKVRPYLRQDL